MATTLSIEDFISISKEMISLCNSKAYVFINQPGLSKLDFTHHKSAMTALYNYAFSSSTAVKFEKIDIRGDDVFEQLIQYTIEKCHIDDRINVQGNITDSFQPYIDTRTKVIRIDFPVLPIEEELTSDKKNRKQVLAEYDHFIRYVLAQIPTPEQTVFYTSMKKAQSNPHEHILPLDIWPEIFEDPNRRVEIDRNNRMIEDPPYFAPYRPKIEQVETKYYTLLDKEFIERNYELLVLIIGSITLFIAFRLIRWAVRSISLQKSKPVSQKKKTQ